jgi:hypothetical protein
MIPDFPHNIRIRLAQLNFFWCPLMLLSLCPVGCLSVSSISWEILGLVRRYVIIPSILIWCCCNPTNRFGLFRKGAIIFYYLFFYLSVANFTNRYIAPLKTDLNKGQLISKGLLVFSIPPKNERKIPYKNSNNLKVMQDIFAFYSQKSHSYHISLASKLMKCCVGFLSQFKL